MKKWKIALALGLVCCILTIAISVQFKTIDNSNSTVVKTLTNNELRDQVLKSKEKYDKEVAELEKSEEKLEEVRLKATANDENAVQKEEQIKVDKMLIGLEDVIGDGLVITLKDNSTVRRSTITSLDDIEQYLVHAVDILEVVNALKNAGAEAISVNDQRVTNYTDIYCAGNVIQINGQKISSPIEIKAIGSPELLYGSLKIPGGYIEILEDSGVIVTMQKQENITIKKYDGILKTQFLTNIN
ncbi:MAG: DUF881 domain-containing protein [Clostridia bacterium]|nr:DUF881 domain-containing protein [Clostridia bacterium]MBR4260927.1 DUF881 domain-containing protein [Clostridia bacterium]